MLRRRAKLVAIKGAAAMTLKGISGFATERKSLLVHFDQLIERIDRELAARMEASAEHRPVCARLREIVGVGPLVGAGLANVLIRVPFRSADAFIAFTGLDPRARDSGEKTGRRRLSKRGPSELRRLLFNAAMSAARTQGMDRGLVRACAVCWAAACRRITWVISCPITQASSSSLLASANSPREMKT